jgi:TIR domain
MDTTPDFWLVTGLSVLLFGFLVLLFGFVVAIYRRGRAVRLAGEKKKSSDTTSAHMTGTPASPPTAARASENLDNTIFISYRRSDSIDITGRIYDRLVTDLGKDAVFKDIDSIPLGSDFRMHIDKSLTNCKVFLFIMGAGWKGDRGASGGYQIDSARDYVRIEVETALRRNIPVIPILVQGIEIPPDEMLPQGIRDIAYRQAIRVRPDPDFHRDLDRLIAFLKGHLRTAS